LRQALKDAGYTFSNVKPKGWHYTGSAEEPLNESIFSYIKAKATAKTRNNASNFNSKSDNIKTVNSNIKNNNKEDNDMKAEIQSLITGKLASKPAKVYKGIYFDSDIATFLDNVQHGNKSELVNKIIRQYLIENELM